MSSAKWRPYWLGLNVLTSSTLWFCPRPQCCPITLYIIMYTPDFIRNKTGKYPIGIFTIDIQYLARVRQICVDSCIWFTLQYYSCMHHLIMLDCVITALTCIIFFGEALTHVLKYITEDLHRSSASQLILPVVCHLFDPKRLSEPVLSFCPLWFNCEANCNESRIADKRCQ